MRMRLSCTFARVALALLVAMAIQGAPAAAGEGGESSAPSSDAVAAAAIRDSLRGSAAALLDKPWAIVYPSTAADTKVRVVVFTDPSCPFCQRLHKDIAQISAAGVELQYNLYARRAAPDLPERDIGWITDFWCLSPEHAHKHIDQMFENARVPAREADEPCQRDVAALLARTPMMLANDMGVRGTPTYLTDSGVWDAGYRDLETFLSRVLPKEQ